MRFVGADGVERDAAEVFYVHPGLAYDISMAKTILAESPREPEWVDLELAFRMILAGEVGIDPQRMLVVDPTAPGIAVRSPAGDILLDGWHRAGGFCLAGRGRMRAFILTEDELLLRVGGHVPAEELAARPEWRTQSRLGEPRS